MLPDVQAYFDSVPEQRRSRLTTLHELIVGLYPNADISLRYKMPTYHYGDGWVAIANQKNYISLYTCSASHIRAFKRRHPSIKTGTGCINFRARDDLPQEDIRDVIRHAIEHPKQ